MAAAMHFPVESLIIAPNRGHYLFVLVDASTLIFSHPWGGGAHTFLFFFCNFFSFSISGNWGLLKASLIA